MRDVPFPVQAALFALILALLEYYVPQQFPAHLGHTWMHLAPRLGPAPWVGAPFYSLVGYWVAVSIALFAQSRLDTAPESWRGLTYAVVGGLAFFALNWAWPLVPDDKGPVLKARFVQGNVGNFIKTSAEAGGESAVRKVYRVYSALSGRPASSPRELTIWPETAYPHVMDSGSMFKSPMAIPRIFNEVVTDGHGALLTGGYDYAQPDVGDGIMSEYNSAFLFQKSGAFDEAELQAVYHKRRLIPFGEGLPFGPLNMWLAPYLKNISFFAQGEQYTQFELQDKRFITLICYEVLFSSDVRSYLNALSKSPHFIVNLTNDSWYGPTSEPFQHMFLGKWRALEFQLPILRATNTGVTSVIYPDGRESKRIMIGQEDTLDVDLKLAANPTPTFFQRYGILPTFLGGLLLALLALLFEKFIFSEKRALP